jgi:hypothetical protein
MDKDIFSRHLDEATKMLVELTKQYCFNDLSDQYRYVLTPNFRTVDPNDEHLSKQEIALLQKWNKQENKLLTTEQVVYLLHHDNMVPLWINMTIYEAREHLTIIDLFCSRRLRAEQDLMHKPVVPPFHMLVPMPPDYEEGVRFDINWKKERFGKKWPAIWLKRIKNVFLKS